MNLLAVQLQKAGLSFLSAKARHGRGGIRVDEIVCANADDAKRVDEWAAKEGYPVEARIASAEELTDFKSMQEML